MLIQVPGEGSLSSRIALIGEAPGSNEAISGKPFVGWAGDRLNSILASAKIARSDCYITNVIKVQPPSNDISIYIDLKAKTPRVTEAAKEYIEFLKEELRSCSANVLVPLGNTALYVLTGERSIMTWRGSLMTSLPEFGSRKVLPTIHPAAALRKPSYSYYIYADMKKVSEECLTPDLVLPKRTLLVAPSFSDAKQFLESLLSNTTEREIAFDIETFNNCVSCFSIATHPDYSMSIPFMYQGDYFAPLQEAEIVKLLCLVLRAPHLTKVMQNAIFDSTYMFKTFGAVCSPIEDTMIAQAIIDPDLDKDLGTLTSLLTREPYYKDQGKKWFKTLGMGWEDFWTYNARDSAVTLECWYKLKSELNRRGHWKAYRQYVDIIKPLIYMEVKGVKVDFEAMASEAVSNRERLVRLKADLQEAVGFPITEKFANSPAQLKEYFYSTCGYKEIRRKDPKTKQMRATTDALALKSLKAQGSKAAGILLEMRKISKLTSTYLEVTLDDDKRYRGKYNPVGTVTGRLSSQKTDEGTGGNRQNIPKSFKRFIFPDPGYFCFYVDLSQAENRIVAHIGPVPRMINAFESGADVHRLTASLIFNIPYESVSDEEYSSPIGDGSKSQRYWGKQCKLGDSQVLTRNGWINIADAYLSNAEIAQWDNGFISFIKPTAWYMDNYSGPIITISNKRFFQEGTPEHKMPLIYNKHRGYEDKLITKPLMRYPSGGDYRAPLSGNYVGGSLILNDALLRLAVAFQADGCWERINKAGVGGIKFGLSKERKLERLRTLLDCTNTPYTSTKNGIHISALSETVIWLMALLGKDKLFGSWVFDLPQSGLATILDEVVHWDGNQVDEYYNTNKINAEIIQTIAHLCGKAASLKAPASCGYRVKQLYVVHIHKETAPATHTMRHTIRWVQNESIYCPTVPSGFFLCRENEKISVTGNSNHSLNYGLGYKKFALRFEIPPTDGYQIVEAYHAAYPEVRHLYQNNIRETLRKPERTLTNLLGHKRRFLNLRMNDANDGGDSWEVAYAHIPQSTVAGIINERGLNYLYYHPQLFEPISLLNQVHDSIEGQIPFVVGFERAAEMLSELQRSLETPLLAPLGEFIIPAEFAVGTCFGYMVKLKGNITAETLQQAVEKSENLQKGEEDE